MIVEFKLANDEIISLSVIKKEDTATKYQLIDQDKFIWMELELVGQNLLVLFNDVRIIDDSETIEQKLDKILYEIIEIEKSLSLIHI